MRYWAYKLASSPNKAFWGNECIKPIIGQELYSIGEIERIVLVYSIGEIECMY